MKATSAIIRRNGGPEVIEWEERELPAPAAGEVQVKTGAAGLNFIDVYHRTGLYKGPLPSGLGVEGAGTVVAVGPEVDGFREGDRVGTFGPARGAYASARNVTADSLVHLPDDIDDETAAAVLLKGCTVEALVERCARVEAGDDVLVHAAAGGVGQLMVQWLKAIGARVIGTVGDEKKADKARALGADEIILYKQEPTAERARELTGGKGVKTVFDGVGKATWEDSLKSARRRGLIVSFGNASGAVDGVNLAILSAHGSLFVTRPTLFDYAVTAEERQESVDRLFDFVRSGKLKVEIGQRFKLTDAAEAQRQLEARSTSGSTVLLP
ncbi:quinone oxidoreductase [Sphingomonas ginkgonis]|uniref:Quinone oxidoreductase n=1 Tax=Sphingomonas ginkgonis TaxID=2315330 RepID=A0A429V8R4_9SPHN|nr:quinone oxidoreductase [Sphingomonas ginkgonis]RST30324.1 quinone oxidoreductase [Sphingomonas ginkgonis]